MTLTSSDLIDRLTESSGPGDTNAQADPDDSLGGFASTTAMVYGIKNGLFRNVSNTERTSGITLYRATFRCNTSTTDTMPMPRFYLSTEVAGGGNIAIGLDPVGVVPTDDDYPQGDTVPNETTAPDGVTFSSPTTFTDGIPVGEDIPPGHGIMLWWRLTVPAAASAVSMDGVHVSIREGS